MSIDELIEALEAATEPCRELDCRIEECIRPGVRCVIGDVGAECTYDCNLWWEPGAYTASIDDALTLVPDGANGHGYDRDPVLGVAAWFSRNCVGDRSHWYYEAQHKSSGAIALCIAALKARKAGHDA